MSDILNNILEKFKKVDGGILDPNRSGADGQEDDFIGKHIDNVDTVESEPADKNKKAADATTTYNRKPHRKGYNPKEDEEVYESSDEGYDIENYFEETEEVDIDMDILKEDTLYFMQIIDEAVAEYIEEEASDEEIQMIEEMLATDEGYMELVDCLFEAKDCDDEDEDEEDDDDEIIDDNPKLKKSKDKVAEEAEADPITKKADYKMVKTKTPEGKVIYRKEKSEVKVN